MTYSQLPWNQVDGIFRQKGRTCRPYPIITVMLYGNNLLKDILFLTAQDKEMAENMILSLYPDSNFRILE